MLVFGILISLLILFFFYRAFLFGSLWLRLPSRWQAQIALNRLGLSAYNDPICHEKCFISREIYKKVVAANLDDESVEAAVQKLILAEDNNLIFRLELVEAVALSKQGVFPDYLRNYLEAGSNLELKDQIQELFVPGGIGLDELRRRASSGLREDRIAALELMASNSDSALAGFYLELITTDPDVLVKGAALRALSNLSVDPDWSDDNFLTQLESVTLDPATNQYLRRDLVMLWSDYLAEKEDWASQVILSVYEDEKFDKFSRLFAADILNRQSSNNYPKPEIGAAEWQEYRNHNVLWENN